MINRLGKLPIIFLSLLSTMTLNAQILIFEDGFECSGLGCSNTPASNYIISRDIITPSLGTSVPEKGEARIDPVTGVRITRLTDASELSGTQDALIVYSRYSPENSTGNLFLAFG